jgi:hypothetical protein
LFLIVIYNLNLSNLLNTKINCNFRQILNWVYISRDNFSNKKNCTLFKFLKNLSYLILTKIPTFRYSLIRLIATRRCRPSELLSTGFAIKNLWETKEFYDHSFTLYSIRKGIVECFCLNFTFKDNQYKL